MSNRWIQRSGLGLLLAGALLMITACDWSAELGIGDNNDDDGNDVTAPVADTDILGLAVAASNQNFDDTTADLDAAISAANRYIAQPRLVDHRDNAAGVNLTLRPTTVFFVDDPNRSAPLIAADPRVALDLPARILVYRDDDNDVGVAYNSAAYLNARFDLDDAEDGALDGLEDDLDDLVETATDGDIDRRGSVAGISDGDGIESAASDNSFGVTVSNLAAAIEANSNLGLVATIDFAQRALSFGRALNPTTLFIFGNPSVGSRLMQSSQTAGIDLPQTMLVSQNDDGDVSVFYEDPAFISDRHNIDDRDDQIEAIARLLANLADTATSVEPGTSTPP